MTQKHAFETVKTSRVAPPEPWPVTRERPPVVVAIAHWNRVDLLRLCLSRVREHTDYPHCRVCVFDQGSTDGSVEYLQSLGSDIDVLYSPDNVGFTLACNAIIDRHPGWDVVLLNNDALVTAGWLSALVATATSADAIGLVGGRLVSSSGVLQEAGGEVFADGRVRARGRGAGASDPRFQERRVVDYCSAACLYVKRAVFDRCGAFDHAYETGYYEDVDLAFRARAAGFTVVYEPRCVVVHDEHSSYGREAAGALMRRHREAFRSRWAVPLATHRHSPFELEPNGRPRLLLVTDVLPGHTLSPRMRRIRQLIRELSGAFEIAYLNAVSSGLDRHAAAIEELGVTPFYVPLGTTPGITGLDEEELVRVNYFAAALCGNPDAALFLRNRFPAEMFEATTIVVDVSMEADVAGAAARTGGTCFIVATDAQRCALLAAMPRAHCAILPLRAEPQAARVLPRETRGDVVLLSDNLDGPAAAEAIAGMLEAIVPALRSRLPHVAMRFCGGALPAALLVRAPSGLEILSSATPIGPVLDRARVVVVPQHWCSPDTMSHIAEARARAVPIVTSSAILHATGLADGIHGLAAETPDAFVEQIVRVHTDASCWHALAQAPAPSSDAPLDELTHAVAAWAAAHE